MDLPISKKPTFLNMTIDFESLVFSDLIDGNRLCRISLENICGNNLDWEWIQKIKIDLNNNNY